MNAEMIFADLETTGLDSERDDITEIAWVTQRGQRAQFYVAYIGFPSLWSARNTAAMKERVSAVSLHYALGRFFEACLELSEGGTRDVHLVGACPAFDDRFLRKHFRELPYHYHVIDVEAMAMGALGWTSPRSLKELRGALGIEGENESAHDALADAMEAKLIYDAIVAGGAR